jgi:hypothetical protein
MLMEMSDVKLKQKQLIVWTMDSIANNTTKKDLSQLGFCGVKDRHSKDLFFFFGFRFAFAFAHCCYHTIHHTTYAGCCYLCYYVELLLVRSLICRIDYCRPL